MDATLTAGEGSRVSTDVARRLALALSQIEGVKGALVCSREGAVLGTTSEADPAREAALASFLAVRAESLSIDSDLRGMGRQLAGSHLQQITLAGPAGEALLLAVRDAYLFVSIAPGRSTPAISLLVAQTAKRYL